MNGADVARGIARDIRRELVCCDVYDRTAKLRDELAAGQPGFGEASLDLDDAINGHNICYWGEAAARIADSHATWIERAAGAPLCVHCGKPATAGVRFIGSNPLCSEPCFALVGEGGHPATALRPGRGACDLCPPVSDVEIAEQMLPAGVEALGRYADSVHALDAAERAADESVARTRRPDRCGACDGPCVEGEYQHGPPCIGDAPAEPTQKGAPEYDPPVARRCRPGCACAGGLGYCTEGGAE